jgi:hypothetical protein
MDTVRAALLLRAKDIMMALQKSKQQRQLDAAAAATAANSTAAAGADGTDSSTEATSAATAAAAAASNRLTTNQHRRLEIELLKLKILQLQHNCRQKVRTDY